MGTALLSSVLCQSGLGAWDQEWSDVAAGIPARPSARRRRAAEDASSAAEDLAA